MSDTTVIPLRKLGKTDLMISALGLGCWQFSKEKGLVGKFWPVLSQSDVTEIVRMSLEGGINWFDTAEVYGKGQSEMALAEALHTIGASEDEVLIATKWWPLLRTARSIGTTIEERKRALQNRTIDLYQVHQPFSFSAVESEMKAMAELVRRGDIRYVGVSNFNEAKMREADAVLEREGLFLASNQVKYSLLDRRIENNGVLAAAKELGITIIAYSPLEQGILSGKFHKNPDLVKNISGPRKYTAAFKPAGLERTKPLIDVLERIAAKYDVSCSQVALNWLISFHGDTVVAIPGASKPHHAKDNIGTLQFQLSAAELEEIDATSRKVSRF